MFQIMFILQNTPMPPLNLPDLSVSLIATGSDSVKFDIVFELYETSDGLRGWLGYLAALFEQNSVRRLLDSYERFLAAVVLDPTQHISKVPLVAKQCSELLASNFAASSCE